MDVWRVLESAAARHPGRPALVEGTLQRDYGSIATRVLALAARLAEVGIGPGERVALLDLNGAGFLETTFAVAARGAILVPLNHRLATPELLRILADAGACALVAGGVFAASAADLAAEARLRCGLVRWDGSLPDGSGVKGRGGASPVVPVRPEDPAHLYYTSGTTGRPKGVVLTHRNVCVHARAALQELDLGPGDVWGHLAPMFHLADAWATIAVTLAGGRHAMVPRFTPEAALAAVERHGITITNLVPTMLNLIVRHPALRRHDLSSLRLVLSGGAPIAPRVVREVLDVLGCAYAQTYGMTETSPYLTLGLLPPHLAALPFEERLSWLCKTGRPFRGVDLRVVGAAGRHVKRDGREVGEIQVRGATVTPGYWNRPEETAAAFVDGWLRTGDLAVMDAEGWVDIVDRAKDVIITGGENVYCIEVENVLYAHPEVLEAAVLGLPDDLWGERVVAAVVPREPGRLAAAALEAWCGERIAGYKVPRSIVFLDRLPRTGSGKTSKRELRARLEQELR